MRGAVLLAASLAACAQPAPPTGRQSQMIIGGAVDTGDPAVVGLDVVFGLCTGTLIAPRVVLTAAHCIKPVVDAHEENRVAAVFGTSFVDPNIVIINGIDATYHKRYNEDAFGTYDVALVLLASDAPVPPVPVNEQDLAGILEPGQTVHSIGWGLDENGEVGTKRHANIPLSAVDAFHISLGRDGLNICSGDSGGPDLFTFPDGVERVVGVHSYGFADCTGRSVSMRPDAFLDDFIRPVLSAWDGPCKNDGVCVTDGCAFPDGDCDDCGFNDRCDERCDQPDLDCPMGGLTGQLCADEYDCESRDCLAAPDDPRVHYCTEECDPATAAYTCGTLSCSLVGDRYLCVYPTPTPTTQGAGCSAARDCRSGLCDTENHICVEECDPSVLAACAAPFTCQTSSLAPHVCDVPVEGTRTFSSLCGAAPGRSNGRGAALVLAAALLITARRRRARP